MKTRNGHKTYPLTVAQKFHIYYMDFCPKKEVVNIGTSLTIEYELDIEELKRAVYKAYERRESMRVRFAYDKKEEQWYQYVVEKEERDIEYVDFTGKTMEEAAEIMTGWTRVPFQREDGPMNRVVMIKTPDGCQGLYVLGDHMLLDAQSLICFLRDVIELYCNAKFEGVAYPLDMRSYIEQLEKDLAYEAGSKAQARDREYFQKLIERSEPIFNGIQGPGQLEEARKKFPGTRAAFSATAEVDSALDIFHLEEEPTAAPDAFLRGTACFPAMPADYGYPHLFAEDERQRRRFHQCGLCKTGYPSGKEIRRHKDTFVSLQNHSFERPDLYGWHSGDPKRSERGVPSYQL